MKARTFNNNSLKNKIQYSYFLAYVDTKDVIIM